MPHYKFNIYLDSPEATLYWEWGKILELEYDRNEGENPPKVDEIVVEAMDYVSDLRDDCEEHILLKRAFAKAMAEWKSFTVKLDLKKSKSC